MVARNSCKSLERKKMKLFFEFGARSQQLGESVQFYFAELSSLAKKAIPMLSSKDREWLIAQKLVDGLAQRSIQDKLISDDYEHMSLDEMLLIAERMENTGRKVHDETTPAGMNDAPSSPWPNRHHNNRGNNYQNNRNHRSNNYDTQFHNNQPDNNANFNHNGNNSAAVYEAELNNMIGYVKINGRQVKCIIETGAARTLISYNMV